MTSEGAVATVASGEQTRPSTIVDHILARVRERADAPCLYTRRPDGWISISWAQFGEAMRRIGSYLISEGCEPGSHAAIWSYNRAEWHIADAGILISRVVPAPIYHTFSAEQAQYVLNHSESRVAFVENETLLARVLQERDQLPLLKRVVVFEGVEEPSPDGFVLPWSTALRRGEEALPATEEELQKRADSSQMSDVVTLIYTSGTTGPPKAVMLTNDNIAAADEGLVGLIEGSENDRILSYLPLAHIAERMVSEFHSYRYGNATWFLDGLPNLGKRLREVRPTQLFGVPRVWEKMAVEVNRQIDSSPFLKRRLARWAIAAGRAVVDAEERGAAVPARLRKRRARADRLVLRTLRAALGLDQATVLASGAAPLDPEVLRFFRSIGLEILEVYGQSENAGITSLTRPGHVRVGTVGQVFPGNQVRIAEDGEILVRGRVVFPGYLKNQEATDETVQDGWLHTGDVGELSDDGYLKITDRKKDLIITAGGKNISPGNLEQALATHPVVGRAVAIGDKRPFMSALFTLDEEEAPRWARERGWPSDVEQLARHQPLLDELQAHVDRVNSRLSQVEQIKKFTVIPHDFQVNDELTPTLKVKRRVVTEKYADLIEAMYAAR
ncbi:MAG: AMP-dependent synthetase/ligase [Candidatus Dormibacteria bacterium]